MFEEMFHISFVESQEIEMRKPEAEAGGNVAAVSMAPMAEAVGWDQLAERRYAFDSNRRMKQRLS